jgi:hypothetical protein
MNSAYGSEIDALLFLPPLVHAHPNVGPRAVVTLAFVVCAHQFFRRSAVIEKTSRWGFGGRGSTKAAEAIVRTGRFHLVGTIRSQSTSADFAITMYRFDLATLRPQKSR